MNCIVISFILLCDWFASCILEMKEEGFRKLDRSFQKYYNIFRQKSVR